LIDEDFTGLCAQETDLVLLQLNLLAWSIASDCALSQCGRCQGQRSLRDKGARTR
jgi:hypothetical protein